MLDRLHNTAKYFFIFILLNALPILANAQNGDNPFDIRSEREILLKNTESSDSLSKPTQNLGTGNPFDIVAPAAGSETSTGSKLKDVVAPIVPTVTDKTISLQEKGQSFLFVIVLGVLLLLTVLVVLSRNLISKIYQSFFNDIILKTLYREKSHLTASIYIALYVMFLVNISVFVFLALYNFNKIFNHSELYTLLYCLVGVSLLFIGKHVLLNILSYTFPVSKEIDLYGFIVMIFSILIGLILAPTNVFLAYSDIETAKLIISIMSVVILIIYVLIALRSLLLAQNYILPNFFHFLLYLCSVEVAPVLILLKLIDNKMELNLI